ncbi:MAG: hypothetical protein JNM43_24710 [Planctomycetaceae bacterium]|nr:hypothetical protein [Planctomycetaceae bacterium]
MTVVLDEKPRADLARRGSNIASRTQIGSVVFSVAFSALDVKTGRKLNDPAK